MLSKWVWAEVGNVSLEIAPTWVLAWARTPTVDGSDVRFAKPAYDLFVDVNRGGKLNDGPKKHSACVRDVQKVSLQTVVLRRQSREGRRAGQRRGSLV